MIGRTATIWRRRCRLLAAPAVLTPAIVRARRGETPVAPDPEAGQAADMLRMLSRLSRRGAAECRALDAYLVTVSDHGLNASTFAGQGRRLHQGRPGLGGALPGSAP